MTGDTGQTGRRREGEQPLSADLIESRDYTPDQIRHVIHELQVHQLELEMQNEELLRTQGELEEARDRFASLYDFAPVGYLTLSPTGTILESNLTLASMLGVTRGHLINTPFGRFVLGEDQDTWYRWLRRARETVSQRALEIRLQSLHGRLQYVRLDSRVLDGTEVTRTTVTDISERKLAEAERGEMERRFLDAQKLEGMGLLAGGIAHDFNNLLTVILGRLDMAAKLIPPDSPAARHLKDAADASRHAADLTRQMLDFAGKGTSVVRRIDLTQALRESANLLRASVARTVEFREQLAPGLPPILADSGKMQQVVMNLVTNASEAIGAEAGVITLSTGASDCDESYLRGSLLADKLRSGIYTYLEVADTGCGMDRRTLERLFDPFFTTKTLGRGLGMSAVMGIVRSHHGAIMIESGAGVGTTVRVLFPVCAFDEVNPDDGLEPPRDMPAGPLSGTVLVVDDEEAVREVCRHMVEETGMRVITAADGEAAVALFRENAGEITCAIVDLSMPRMDGVTAYHEIKRIRPDARVILATGHDESEALKRFAGDGPAAVIQKPYRADRLAATIRAVIQNTPAAFNKST